MLLMRKLRHKHVNRLTTGVEMDEARIWTLAVWVQSHVFNLNFIESIRMGALY